MLFVSRTGLGFQFQTLGSVSDHLVDIFGFSFAEVGMLIGAFLLPGMVLAVPCGFAGRYTSDRLLVTIGLVFLALGGASAILATSFGMFAFARIICGIGFVVTTIYFTKMVADWFDGKELATAMAVLVMSWPFGIAMGQVGHTWLAALFDWRMAFVAASIYCGLGALGVFSMYRMPEYATHPATPPQWGLPGNELTLTLLASVVWALFNSAYIVFLSFGARVLIDGGYGLTGAATVISLASWVMLFSGAICGQISDRLGKPDTVLYLCLAGGIASLLLLPWTQFAMGLSLLFGLIGMAPAGVIMALTTQAMLLIDEHLELGFSLVVTSLLRRPHQGLLAGYLIQPALLIGPLYLLRSCSYSQELQTLYFDMPKLGYQNQRTHLRLNKMCSNHGL